MERNPDDIFNPSDINHEPSSRKKTSVKQLISKEIKNTFEKYIGKSIVGDTKFNKIESIEEDIALSYILEFESDVEEYELTYLIPSALTTILEPNNEDLIATNKKIFENLSHSIIDRLNEEDIAFLQDVELIDLTNQIVEDKNMKNLYSINLSIDKNEYVLYLHLDEQFNKIS